MCPGNLDDWYEKFKHYKNYPVVGKVSFPPTDLRLTRDQLKDFVGRGDVPEGRVDAPIYIGLCGKIFDGIIRSFFEKCFLFPFQFSKLIFLCVGI